LGLGLLRLGTALQAAVDEAVGGGPEPGGVVVEERGRVHARPLGGQQHRRELRVAEEERAPGVDEPEPGRVGVLVARPRPGRPDDRGEPLDEPLVGRADLGQVPGPADQGDGARGAGGVAGPEPLVPDAGLVEQRLQLVGLARGDPGRRVDRAVPEEAEVGREPAPFAPLSRQIEHDQVEMSVPFAPSRPVDAGGRLVEPPDTLGRQAVPWSGRHSRRMEPPLSDHARHRRPDGGRRDPERGEETHERGDGGSAASRTEVVAV
jgi:hypothetical protein